MVRDRDGPTDLSSLSSSHTPMPHFRFIHSADPAGQEMHPGEAGSEGLISRKGTLNLLVFGLHSDFASSSFSLDLSLHIGILLIRHPDPFLTWVTKSNQSINQTLSGPPSVPWDVYAKAVIPTSFHPPVFTGSPSART